MDSLVFSLPRIAGAALISPDACTSRHAAQLTTVHFHPRVARSNGRGRRGVSVLVYVAPAGAASRANSSQQSNDKVYTVGDFMTSKERLLVVKPTTTVDKALQMLVDYCITVFPVVDDNWRLIGVVSDYDFLALDSISGKTTRINTSFFPNVDSSWKTFHQIQNFLTKNSGKFIADVMTSFPLVVNESSNIEDVARLFLETKYHHLPVVDSVGKLVGIITRGDLLRAALQIKHDKERT